MNLHLGKLVFRKEMRLQNTLSETFYDGIFDSWSPDFSEIFDKLY